MSDQVLRPIAEGDDTNLQKDGADENWDCVDEEVADEDSTYVYRQLVGPAIDYYNLPAPEELGTIVYLQISDRCRRATATGTAKKQNILRLNAQDILGNEVILTQSYALRSDGYYTNPLTGERWTWAEVAALQAGIKLSSSILGARQSRCTQLYVLVESYYPPVVETHEAESVGTNQALLKGYLGETEGWTCKCRFQYGKTIEYDHETEWQEGLEAETPFEQLVTGLDPDTDYHFRAVANNTYEDGYGEDKVFHTEALPTEAPVTQKVLVRHPGILSVHVTKEGQETTKYDELSNLDQERLETSLEIPVSPPCTVEVTTLTGETWSYYIKSPTT